VLYCIECGCCSGELGKGWVAFRCDDPDPDEPDDGRPMIAVYCPACAAREFGYQPGVGATYVCSWVPVAGTAFGLDDDAVGTFEPPTDAPPADALPTSGDREPARAYGVTMVRPGVVPSFEVGAYEYFGRGLPLVGEIIVIRRIQGPDAGETTQGYVTRLNLDSNPPIAVTEVVNASHLGEAR
jgi:hypothetical protein